MNRGVDDTGGESLDYVVNRLGQRVGLPLAGWTPPPGPGAAAMPGRYCTVEALDPEQHAESLYAADSLDVQGKSWTYLPYGPFATPSQYLQWVSAVAAAEDPRFFAIVRNEDRRAVGVASYLRITPATGSIEVGHIHYSPLLSRTPAATEAMYLMMKRAFELGYRRYEWKCDALNEASRAAAVRLGLSFEGIFRQATVYRGRNRDTAWYAAVDVDWPRLREAFERWLAPSNFDDSGHQRERLSALTRPVVRRADPTHGGTLSGEPAGSRQ